MISFSLYKTNVINWKRLYEKGEIFVILNEYTNLRKIITYKVIILVVRILTDSTSIKNISLCIFISISYFILKNLY